MKRIQLGKRAWLYQGLCALVDDEDYERLVKYNWHVLPREKYSTFNAVRNAAWINTQTGCRKYTTVSMHREVLNASSDVEIRHKNGDGLDNRKENLEIIPINRGKSYVQEE